MINQVKQLPCYSRKNFNKVKKIVFRALKYNKFYQKKYKNLKLKTSNFNTWNDYFKLPITTKDELSKDQIKHLPFGSNYSCNKKDVLFFASTSGTSTGKQLIIPYSQKERQEYVKYWTLNHQFKGINNKDVLLRTDGELDIFLQGKTSEKLGIKTLFYSFGGASEIYQKLKKFNVTALFCYPTEILQLIEYITENKLNFRQLKLRKLFTHGEPGWNNKKLRQTVEKKLNVKWIDQLASVETEYTGQSCHKCEKYHFFPNSKIVEIIHPQTNQQTDMGEIIETSLMRIDNPYIRYKTNDLTKISYSKKCQQIVFNGIIGRTQDLAIFNGENLNTKYLEIQIKSINPLSHFLILIEKNKGVDFFEFFYETKSQKEINQLFQITQKLKENYFTFPKIFLLPQNSIPIKRKKHKSKSIYDLRKKDYPKFNYKKLYKISQNYQVRLKIKNKVKKILNLPTRLYSLYNQSNT